MEKADDKRFIHSGGARIVAGLIGVLAGGFIFVNWPDEVKEFSSSFGSENKQPLIQPVGIERVSEENPALKACLEERVGHVNQMKEEGVIGDEQVDLFITRATQLCQAQNSN